MHYLLNRTLGLIPRPLRRKGKKRSTLEDILSRVMPRDSALHLLHSAPAGMLCTEIAAATGQTERSVMEVLSEALELPFEPTISAPDIKFIEMLGIDQNELENACAVPQQLSPAGSTFSITHYALALSDPRLLAIETFAKQGVVVMLTSQQEILRAWHEFANRSDITAHRQTKDSLMFEALAELADEALRCGAKEVILGLPEASFYEFQCPAGLYRGKLEAEVLHTLAEVLRQSPSLTREVEKSNIHTLQFLAAHIPNKEAIYLRWKSHAPKELKLQPGKTKLKASYAAPQERVQGTRPVLILDDDPRFTKVLSNILQAKGWSPTVLHDGFDALAELQHTETQPLLIVCDVHMPRMDGITFLKQLRTSGLNRPILMLTSDDDRMLEAELVILGADAFVRKQEDPRILVAWCENLARRTTNTPAVSVSSNGHKTHVPDFQGITERPS